MPNLQGVQVCFTICKAWLPGQKRLVTALSLCRLQAWCVVVSQRYQGQSVRTSL